MKNSLIASFLLAGLAIVGARYSFAPLPYAANSKEVKLHCHWFNLSKCARNFDNTGTGMFVELTDGGTAQFTDYTNGPKPSEKASLVSLVFGIRPVEVHIVFNKAARVGHMARTYGAQFVFPLRASAENITGAESKPVTPSPNDTLSWNSPTNKLT
jgi:hypothetical protein